MASHNNKHIRSTLLVVLLFLLPLLLLGLSSQVNDRWIPTEYQQGVENPDDMQEADSVMVVDSYWYNDIEACSGIASISSKGNYTPATDTMIPIDEEITRPEQYDEWMSIPEGYGIYGEFEIVGTGYVTLDVVEEDEIIGHNLGSFSELHDLSFIWIPQWSRTYRFRFIIPLWVSGYGTPSSTAHFRGFIGIDETPPEISLSLENDQTTISHYYGGSVMMSGKMTIDATIEDQVFGIHSLNLYMDDMDLGPSYGGGSLILEYEWEIDTTRYANGDHEIRVVATDNAGNEKTVIVYLQIQNANSAPLVIGAATIIGMVAVVTIIKVKIMGTKKKGKGSSTKPAFLPQEHPEDDSLEFRSDTQTIAAPAQIVCPFCRSKTEAGLVKCKVCGAEL